MKRNLTTLPLLCRLFRGIPPEEVGPFLERLGAVFRRLEKDEVLFRIGSPAESFAVVLSGTLAVSAYDEEGRRNIVEEIEPMESIGTALSISEVQALSVEVAAKTDAEVIVLKAERVLKSCTGPYETHLAFLRNLVAALAGKAVVLGRKISLISRRTTAERLMMYLRGQAAKNGSDEFDIPLDRQALADYLCVERSALSAEISKLRRKGLIETRKNHFRILAPQA